jgi:hypothetical protein
MPLRALEPKSSASANSATFAQSIKTILSSPGRMLANLYVLPKSKRRNFMATIRGKARNKPAS